NKYRVKPSVWFVEKEEEIIADLNSANAEFNIVFDKWLTEFLNEFSMPHCMKALMQHDDLRKNAGGLVETVKRVRTALIAAINLGFEAGFTSDIRNSYSRRGVNATLERWSLEDLVSLVEELRAATVEAVSKMNGELDEAKSTIENKEVECGALKSSRDKFRLAFLALLASMIPAGVITGSIGVGATYAYMTYGQEAPLLEEAPEVEVGE
ncbi:hypothetical protein HOH67_02130, partial [Candidatus Peregrinibacteria bacterium]|nr:hypothetical protein [Candidatus Peregrinibacteria bacterium]